MVAMSGPVTPDIQMTWWSVALALVGVALLAHWFLTRKK